MLYVSPQMVTDVNVLIDESVDDFVKDCGRTTRKSCRFGLQVSPTRVQPDRVPMSNRNDEVMGKQQSYVTNRDALCRFGIRDRLQHKTGVIVIEIEFWSLPPRQRIFHREIGDVEPSRVRLNLAERRVNEPDPRETLAAGIMATVAARGVDANSLTLDVGRFIHEHDATIPASRERMVTPEPT
jgi:hypothetical protein